MPCIPNCHSPRRADGVGHGPASTAWRRDRNTASAASDTSSATRPGARSRRRPAASTLAATALATTPGRQSVVVNTRCSGTAAVATSTRVTTAIMRSRLT